MPSFFERLRRVINGENAYRPGEDSDDPMQVHDKDDWDMPSQARDTSPAQPQTTDAPKPAGPKIIPQATIVKVENRVSGSYLDISITVQNNSQIDVELESVHLLGREYRLSFTLPPGRMQEFVSVYNGPLLNNRNYTKCELYYKKPEDTDAFKANHLVEFRQEADGTYTISRIRFIPPVQDI